MTTKSDAAAIWQAFAAVAVYVAINTYSREQFGHAWLDNEYGHWTMVAIAFLVGTVIVRSVVGLVQWFDGERVYPWSKRS